jgi:Protein of unknown function (DUF664)
MLLVIWFDHREALILPFVGRSKSRPPTFVCAHMIAVMTPLDTQSSETFTMSFDQQIRVFIDEHRRGLDACLDDLTEEQARRKLVASNTTLLGLVKHATFVEQVWFQEALTGQSRTELGIVAGPDESFVLAPSDTIESIRLAYRSTCERSSEAIANLDLDSIVTGNRRGPLPLRWIMIHVLREIATHCGHADILREQILGAPSS